MARSGRARALALFALSVTITQSLVAFGIYLVVLLDAQQELHADFAGVLLQAQSALATFLGIQQPLADSLHCATE